MSFGNDELFHVPLLFLEKGSCVGFSVLDKKLLNPKP